MRTRRFTPDEVRVHASHLLELQHAAYAVEAQLIGDDRIPPLHETESDLLSSGLDWLAPGARVVKAFNVYPAGRWEAATAHDVVALAGDDDLALDTVGRLVRAVGATPHTVGGLHRARQIEELAGMVIALAFAGIDPRSAVPGIG